MGGRSRLSVVGRRVCCFLGEEPLGGIVEEEDEEAGGSGVRLKEGFDGEGEEMGWGEEDVGRWREEVARSTGVQVGGVDGKGGRWNGEELGRVGFKGRRVA